MILGNLKDRVNRLFETKTEKSGLKTNVKTIAEILATAIWTDNVYDEAERAALKEIADTFGLDELALVCAVENELDVVKEMTPQEITNYLNAAGATVEDEEIGQVFEAFMQILLNDDKLSSNEATNLLVASKSLGIKEEDLILMLFDKSSALNLQRNGNWDVERFLTKMSGNVTEFTQNIVAKTKQKLASGIEKIQAKED